MLFVAGNFKVRSLFLIEKQVNEQSHTYIAISTIPTPIPTIFKKKRYVSIDVEHLDQDISPSLTTTVYDIYVPVNYGPSAFPSRGRILSDFP